MTLNIQKRFPFPPAIVIEIQNGSPSQSNLSSHEKLVQTPLFSCSNEENRSLNDVPPLSYHINSKSPESKETPKSSHKHRHKQSIPFERHTPELCSERRLSFAPDGNQKIEKNTQDKFSPHHGHTTDVVPERCFLGVPNDTQCIRCIKSRQSVTALMNSELALKFEKTEYPDKLSSNKFYRSLSSASFHKVSGNTLRPRMSELDNYSEENFQGDKHSVPVFKVNRKEKDHVATKPSYSSSDASSSRVSSQDMSNFWAKPSRLHSSCRCTPMQKSDGGLNRSFSLADSCRSFDPNMTAYMKCKLTEPFACGHRSYGQRSRSQPRDPDYLGYADFSFRKYRKYTQSMWPSRYYINNIDELLPTNHSCDVPPIVVQRRHTDGSDIYSQYLAPLILSRRANSVSLQPTRNDIIRLGAHSTSIHPSSCINCFRSQVNTFHLPAHVGTDLEKTSNQKSELSKTETQRTAPKNAKKLSYDTTNHPDESEVGVKGLFYCKLTVFLITMKIFLGIATTTLGLYLRLKVPLLPVEECAFWAAIPISLSGLVGSYLCFPNRMRCPIRISTIIARRSAGALSLISCVVCLVASVFSGQKGSLIAAYGIETCSPTSTTKSSDGITNSSRTSTGMETGFQLQCCLDELDPYNRVTCNCFNARNQLLWGYHDITCRFLVSSVKDYLILQCALMAVGAGVCMWFWIVLTEQNFTQRFTSHNDKKKSGSSSKKRFSETTTTSIDGKRSSIDELEVSWSKNPVTYLIKEHAGTCCRLSQSSTTNYDDLENQMKNNDQKKLNDTSKNQWNNSTFNEESEIVKLDEEVSVMMSKQADRPLTPDNYSMMQTCFEGPGVLSTPRSN